MQDEDPEKRRLRQLAETAGSLAPRRIGAWTTRGYVAGDSWASLPWLGRVVFVVLFAMLAAGFVFLAAVILRAGEVGVAACIVAWAALLVCLFFVGRARRRRRPARNDQA